jgi:hypothetical protein
MKLDKSVDEAKDHAKLIWVTSFQQSKVFSVTSLCRPNALTPCKFGMGGVPCVFYKAPSWGDDAFHPRNFATKGDHLSLNKIPSWQRSGFSPWFGNTMQVIPRQQDGINHSTSPVESSGVIARKPTWDPGGVAIYESDVFVQGSAPIVRYLLKHTPDNMLLDLVCLSEKYIQHALICSLLACMEEEVDLAGYIPTLMLVLLNDKYIKFKQAIHKNLQFDSRSVALIFPWDPGSLLWSLQFITADQFLCLEEFKGSGSCTSTYLQLALKEIVSFRWGAQFSIFWWRMWALLHRLLYSYGQHTYFSYFAVWCIWPLECNQQKIQDWQILQLITSRPAPSKVDFLCMHAWENQVIRFAEIWMLGLPAASVLFHIISIHKLNTTVMRLLYSELWKPRCKHYFAAAGLSGNFSCYYDFEMILTENYSLLQNLFQFLASSCCTCSLSHWSTFCAMHQGVINIAVLRSDAFKGITSERQLFVFQSIRKCQDFCPLVFSAHKLQYTTWDPGIHLSVCAISVAIGAKYAYDGALTMHLHRVDTATWASRCLGTSNILPGR